MPLPVIYDAWQRAEGGTAPFGVTWIDSEQNYQFVLYSRSAGSVTLLLYSDQDLVNPLQSFPFQFPANKTGRIWHLNVSATDARDAKYYAYQINAPTTPQLGSRFDPDKILLDPYARGIYFPPGLDRGAACQPGSNAGKAPLGCLPEKVPTAQQGDRPAAHRHSYDLIIYEMHVRGFTYDESSGVAFAHRGTFAGIIDKIPYLQQLGITAVELMPVHQFDPAEGNYWGYMTLSFFTPNLQYGVGPGPEDVVSEFRNMVDALHTAGIEVFLDVVYNHTTEAGPDGPTYSWRGIENRTYYALQADDVTYENHSGCGNDLRTAHPVVRKFVMDSVRYWTNEMGVDGYRFDLASILARSETDELEELDPPMISEMSSDPSLANCRLIAEPWEGDSDGYLMGQLFPGKTWRQWNDHFRDDIRSFVKSDPGLVGSLMQRLYGSTDRFPDDFFSNFRPMQNVNYVDSHDGFCMYDLVAYTDASQNSWNCGFEGEDGVPADVLQLRKQQVKNFCSLLMLSNGTPMFHMGDECLRTQGGNANPWDQDNQTTWFDWNLVQTNADILRFFQMMIAFRKSHPAIARSTGWRENVRWYGINGAVDLSSGSYCLAYFLGGSDMGDKNFYVMINAYWEPLEFTIQEGQSWKRIVDTSQASPTDILADSDGVSLTANNYTVGARSLVVLTT